MREENNFASMTLGQKKVGFVKWLMKKGVSKEKAKLICSRKFYHETREENRNKHYELVQKCLKEKKCECGNSLDESNNLRDLGYEYGIECSYCA